MISTPGEVSFGFRVVGPTLSHPCDQARLRSAAEAMIEIRYSKSARDREDARLALLGLVDTLLVMASVGGPGPSVSAAVLTERLIELDDGQLPGWQFMALAEAEILLASSGGVVSDHMPRLGSGGL